MDVDSFIAEHRPEWRRLEDACAKGPRGLMQRSGADISEVVRLYLRTSTHLAEVRSRYRDRELEAYLSRVVASAHGAVYGARPGSRRDVLATFGSRYRAAVRRTLPFVAIAAAVLLVVTAAVALWVLWSPQGQAGVVPEFARGLVDRAGGDLRDPSGVLSGFIFFNNVRVAVLAFALGITLGTGTLFVLVQNSVLIGALAGAAHVAGTGGRFWALVLPHGWLELIAIAIAAGSGLRIGWSLIEPGDRPRSEALADEARDAVLVVVGVVPAFLVAALIEGLLTGVTGQPAIEIGSGAAVAFGYVLLLTGLPGGVASGRRGRTRGGPASAEPATTGGPVTGDRWP